MSPSKATRMAVQCVIDSLYSDPDRWRVGTHTAIGPGGVEIWIANGWECCTIEQPNKMKMGPVLRWRLYRAVRMVQAAKIATAAATLAGGVR